MDKKPIGALEQKTKCALFTYFVLLFYIFHVVLQKFFDLERENTCATKELKDHTFPKLNRNKYMVTDGAAYIGRCVGGKAP